MSKKTRGRKKKAYERNTSRVYEWGSPTLRLLGDLCLLGVVLVVVAVAFTYKTQGLALRIFPGCFLFFGIAEFLRAADNRAKGGPKKNTIIYCTLGGAMIVAGVVFYLLATSGQPLPAA
ncbi:MAG: hypothetical protein ACOYIR_05160 [Christensenellales bacterium]|jgi:zinc transporter ZupT